METKVATKRQPAVARKQSTDFTDQLIEPFNQLRNEVDRLFEGFPFRVPQLAIPRFVRAPALEMTQTDKAYKVTAELPGMEPEDVEITFDDGILRIAGEKSQQREETERDYRLSERSYGAFERLIGLPTTANPEKIDAKFKNGVLTVTIGKNGDEKARVRRIAINKG